MIEKPKLPLNKFIIEGTTGECKKCHSTLKRKYLIIKTDKCINQECENYYDRK